MEAPTLSKPIIRKTRAQNSHSRRAGDFAEKFVCDLRSQPRLFVGRGFFLTAKRRKISMNHLIEDRQKSLQGLQGKAVSGGAADERQPKVTVQTNL